MRFYNIIIFLFTSLFCFASCGSDSSDDNGDNGGGASNTLKVTPESLEATTDGGTYTLTVSGAPKEWKAYSNNDWIKVTTTGTTSSNGTITVEVSPNTKTEARSGAVNVSSGINSVSIPVSQQAYVPAPVPDSIKAPDGYKLVWHDEFDGNKLSSDWTHEVQGAGWVNNELQNYINSDRVTSVSDGVLNINCIKSNGTIYSGRIYACRNTGWTYGWFEAKIMLPKGRGTWPAFWMMPVKYTSWPADGENDIMEEVGYNPNYVSSTIHCTRYNNGNTSKEHKEVYIANAEGGWHTYACEWTANSLSYYIDGNKYFTYTPDQKTKDYWPFDSPFYIILNLAWGGSWGGLQGTDDSALPATMKVDYVRVFQK